MAASVRIEDEAFSDVRFQILATGCQLADASHAIGKMAILWRQCTALNTYVLSESTITAVLGPRGVESLVESQLGERVDDGIRIRGTKGRIEWLKKLRKNAQKGGKAKAAKRQTRGKQEAAKSLPPPFPPAPAPTPILREEEKSISPVGESHPGYREVIDDFDGRYRESYGTSATWGAKQGSHVKRLLKAHGEVEVRRRIENMFTSPPSWLKPPFDFGTFVQHFDKFVVGASQQTFRHREQIG